MSIGRVVSVNVGLPRPLLVGGSEVQSAIVKEPVAEGARLRTLGFEGDGQADHRVHGGPLQAAYLYSVEHYPHWRSFLDRPDLPWGFFGENLSVEGLTEDVVRIGDVYAIGEARARITRPRGPCSKLAARVGRPHFIAEFLAAGRLGSYLSVEREGLVRPGDTIELVDRPPGAVTMGELIRALYDEAAPTEFLERVAAAPAVDVNHRDRIAHRLEHTRRD
jgi:MOSC domain-containing protein YiiM